MAKETSRFLMDHTPLRDKYRYHLSLREMKLRMEAEDSLDDILDTVLDVKPGYPPYHLYASQIRNEIESLATLVEKEKPRNVLEIGTARGGTFYIWSRYFNTIDKIISLDLPDGRFGGGYNEKKTNIFQEFAPSNDMYFVRDNSHQKETYERVSHIVDGSVDFLFIDGDHTYEGVKKDFYMYSELVSKGGIIALHDIVTHPDEINPDCNVDQFWEELVNKDKYDTKEIISDENQGWGGIGVVQI